MIMSACNINIYVLICGRPSQLYMQLKQLKKELHIKPEKIQETNLSIRAVNNSFPSCGGFISQFLVAETKQHIL